MSMLWMSRSHCVYAVHHYHHSISGIVIALIVRMSECVRLFLLIIIIGSFVISFFFGSFSFLKCFFVIRYFYYMVHSLLIDQSISLQNAIGFKCQCLVSISIPFSHFSFSTFFAFLSVFLFFLSFFHIYKTRIQNDISSSMANRRIVQIYICKFFHTNKTIAM